jgi:hypothetical protein
VIQKLTVLFKSSKLAISGIPSQVLGKIQPGVDVMITIFCDFRQFSAKIGVFLKTNVIIKILHNLA